MDRVQKLDAINNCPKQFPNNKKEFVLNTFSSAEQAYLKFKKNPKDFTDEDVEIYPQFEKEYFNKLDEFSNYCGVASQAKTQTQTTTNQPKKIETKEDADKRIKALQTILKYNPDDSNAQKRIKQIETLKKYL